MPVAGPYVPDWFVDNVYKDVLEYIYSKRYIEREPLHPAIHPQFFIDNVTKDFEEGKALLRQALDKLLTAQSYADF